MPPVLFSLADENTLLSTSLMAFKKQHGFSVKKRYELSRSLLHTSKRDRAIEMLSSVSTDSYRFAEKQLRYCENKNIQLISILSPEYPPELREIQDPPLLIFVQGNLCLHSTNIAIVGMRNASNYGRRIARRLASELVAYNGDIQVISGLARGIDTEAHLGAMEGCKGNPGIAVLGSGLSNIYPKENNVLAEQFLNNGGVLVSEYEPETSPRAFFFPERNRIISALSSAVVVVEAAAKSGSLITARLAAEYGKEVCVVPNRIDNQGGDGPFKLLNEGATPIRSADDIISALPYRIRQKCLKTSKQKNGRLKDTKESPRHTSNSQHTTKEEQQILNLISKNGEAHLDDIIEQLGYTTEQTLALMVQLELKGQIQRFDGDYFSLP